MPLKRFYDCYFCLKILKDFVMLLSKKKKALECHVDSMDKEKVTDFLQRFNQINLLYHKPL